MLNIFGRIRRSKPPSTSFPLPGSRFIATARAATPLHPRNWNHGYDEEDMIYTAEEEREMAEFLDRDLPPQVHFNRFEAATDPLPHRHHIRTTAKPAPPSGQSSPKSDAPSPKRRARKRPVGTGHKPPGLKSARVRKGSLIAALWREAEGEDVTIQQHPSSIVQSDTSDHPPIWYASGRPAIGIVSTLRTPYEPQGHLKEFPWVSLTLRIDPVGLQPSLNAALYDLGLYSKGQSVVKRRSTKLNHSMRRMVHLISREFLTESQAEERIRGTRVQRRIIRQERPRKTGFHKKREPEFYLDD